MPEPIEDAQVVSEGPKNPPPPPRVAELKPAPAGEAFSVFDGPVADAKNAKRKPNGAAPRPRPAANGKGKGAKKPSEPAAAAAGPSSPPGVDPEVAKRVRAQVKARRLLQLYERWQLGMVRGRYREILDPASLHGLLELLKYQPEILQALSEQLGEGMVENEVELPWWAEFGSLFLADLFMKRQLLEKVELKYQEHLQQKEAAAPPAAKAA